MPRQVRVQYEDAIYHVMARGNRLDRIARSDADRRRVSPWIVDLLVVRRGPGHDCPGKQKKGSGIEMVHYKIIDTYTPTGFSF